MTDYYLKFADEAEAESVLTMFRVEDDDDNVVWATHCSIGDLDVIGEIWVNEVKLDGWHANFRGEPQPEWQGYLVYPTDPVRGWA